MRKKWILASVLLFLLIFVVAFQQSYAKSDLFLEVDYSCCGVDRVNAVGIEKADRTYLLKYCLLQEGISLKEEILSSSINPLTKPQLFMADESLMVVTYQEWLNDHPYSQLMVRFEGEWQLVDLSQVFFSPDIWQIELLATNVDAKEILLGYIQNNLLSIIRYDVFTGQLAVVYTEEMLEQRIYDLTIKSIDGMLILAYKYREGDWENLQIRQIGLRDSFDQNLLFKKVKGYDLAYSKDKNHLILAYEIDEGEFDIVNILAFSDANKQKKVGAIRKRDKNSNGIKLLTKGENLAILYRDYGVMQKFELYLTHIFENSLTIPYGLNYDGSQIYLTNIKENIQELGAGLYSFHSDLLNQRVSKEVLRPFIFDSDILNLDSTECKTEVITPVYQRSIGKKIHLPDSIAGICQNVNLNIPGKMIEDGKGTVYLLDEGKLWVLDLNHQIMDYWTYKDSNSYLLKDIAFGKDGYLYLLDGQTNQIMRCSSDGTLVENWNVEFDNLDLPTAITFDSQGNLYVSKMGTISKYDQFGQRLLQWNLKGESGIVPHPIQITFDHADRLYVVDVAQHKIQIYTSEGQFIQESNGWGSGAGYFRKPVDIAIAGDKVYIADQGNHRVQVLNLELQYLFEFGTSGASLGEIGKISSIIVDSEDRILIADQLNHSLQLISPKNQLLAAWRGGDWLEPFASLESVVGVNGAYYYWSKEKQQLLQYDSNLNFVREIKLSAKNNGIYAAFTADKDYFYCTDLLNQCVVIYNHQGQKIRNFKLSGNEFSATIKPLGIARDQLGNLYVTDFQHDRILKFFLDGTFISQWGRESSIQHLFIHPLSITSVKDQLYVTDLAGERVQAFALDGHKIKQWDGFGNGSSQLPYQDYYVGDLVENYGLQDVHDFYQPDLPNDLIPTQKRVWNWSEKWGYKYRYTLTQDKLSKIKMDYIPLGKIEQGEVNGEYYFHLQSIKEFIHQVPLAESSIWTYRTLFDNTPPTVTMPNNSTVPMKFYMLKWEGVDNITEANHLLLYKYLVTTIPPEKWGEDEHSKWSKLKFDHTTSTVVHKGTGISYLNVQAIDQAGNQSKIYTTKFVLDGTSLSTKGIHDQTWNDGVVIKELIQNDWHITVALNTENEILASEVAIPTIYDFKVFDGIKYISAETVEFEEASWGEYFSGQNKRIKYKINISGHVFTGEGIRVDKTGLYLDSISINTPEEYWTNSTGEIDERNKKFAYQDIKIAATNGNHVVGTYVDYKTDCVSMQIWKLKIQYIYLDEIGLSLKGTVNLKKAYVANEVSFSRLTLGQDLFLVSGVLEEAYDLVLPASCTLKVHSSRLSATNLIIDHASVILHDDIHTITVNLKNFTIDFTGTVRTQSGFSSDAFECKYSTISYSAPVNCCGFIQNKLYLLSGNALMPSKDVLTIENVPVNSENKLTVQGVPIYSEIQKKINGVVFEGYHGTQVDKRIIYSQGFITLPISNGMGDHVSLTVSSLPFSISGGFDYGNIAFLESTFTYHMLADVEVEQISPSEEGFRLGGVVTLAGHLPIGLNYEHFAIRELNVSENGVLNFTLDPGLRSISLCSAFTICPASIILMPKSLCISGGNIKSSGKVADIVSNAQLSDLHLVKIDNSGMIVQFDSEIETIAANLLGMSANLKVDRIDERKITFTGQAHLPLSFPGELSGLGLDVKSVSIDYRTGDILSLEAIPDTNILTIGEWNYEFNSFGVKNNKLSASAKLHMPSTGRLAQMLPNLANEYVQLNQLLFDQIGQVSELELIFVRNFDFELIPNVDLIASGLGVAITNGSLETLALTFSGAQIKLPIQFGDNLLRISNLLINSSGEFMQDAIQLIDYDLQFMNVVDVSLLSISFGVSSFSLDGQIVLSNIFPSGLSGQTFPISNLELTSMSISDFQIGVDMAENFNLFNVIQFNINDFSLENDGLTVGAGFLEFMDSFALATNTFDEQFNVQQLKIDYTGQITNLDVSFPEEFQMAILGCQVNLTSIDFPEGNVKLGGNIILPEYLPDGLGSMSVDIYTLELTQNGTVIDFNVGADDLNLTFNVYGANVTVDYIAISQVYGYQMDALITIPDDAAIPTGLRGTTTAIDNLTIGYDSHQIEDFSVTINKNVQFSIAQVEFEITQVTFKKDYFALVGSLGLPDAFPGPLGNACIEFSDLQMWYLGSIKFIDANIQVGTELLNFALGDYFNVEVNGFGIGVLNGNLSFSVADISISMSGPIEFNITFDDITLGIDGNFSANVQPGFSFDFNLAGAKLELFDPCFDGIQIGTGMANFTLPEFLGGVSIGLPDVSIHSLEGLKLGSGGSLSFGFPDINIGFVAIYDAYMSLRLENNKYFFEGNGGALIPGVGCVEANIKLVSQSSDYPNGIERIRLSFTSTGLGLPLGSTGLFINGIYGEYAEGPIPANSPQVVKRLGDGTRFCLGVFVTDPSQFILKGSPGFWINISNGNSAMVGEVGLLDNLVKTDIFVAICDHFADFYAEANISFLNGTVDGNAGFHIWAQDSHTYLTGWAKASIKIKKGAILKKRFIKIPSKTRKLFSAGSEFGNFRNNVKGVKSYIKVPIVGQVGIFAGNIGFKIGNVKKYVLMDNRAKAYALDDKEYVSFEVTGEARGQLNTNPTSEELERYFVESTEHLVIAVGYPEGELDLEAIAPDGTRITKFSKGVEYAKEANQCILSIEKPKPGIWNLEILNAKGIDYEVEIFGLTPQPELVVDTIEKTAEGYLIAGYGGVFTGKECYVDLYIDSNEKGYDGRLLAEQIPLVNNRFTYTLRKNDLRDGKYYVFGKLYEDEVELPSALSYGRAAMYIVGDAPLTPPQQVSAVLLADKVAIRWSESRSSNAVGYRVYYGVASARSSFIDTGSNLTTTIPIPKGLCEIYVVAYDESGNESAQSSRVIIDPKEPESEIFNLSEINAPENISIYIGEGDEVIMPFTAVEKPSGQRGDYFIAKLEGLPSGVMATFDQPVYNLYEDKEVKIKISALAKEVGESVLTQMSHAESGKTLIYLVLTCAGNSKLTYKREILLTLQYRKPVLYEVNPTFGLENQQQMIELTGDYFSEDSVVYLHDKPLETKYVDKNSLITLVPEYFKKGIYDLCVVNNGQQSAFYEKGYEILGPDFLLKSLSSRMVMQENDTAKLYLTAHESYGFAENVLITPADIPNGINILEESQLIRCGDEAEFTVNTAQGLASGEYLLRFKGVADTQSHEITVMITVAKELSTPQIESFYRAYALPGEQMIAYGYNFGEVGHLSMNQQSLAVISWNPNRIEFVVPAEPGVGELVVDNGKALSNPVEFVIKSKHYSIHTEQEEYRVLRDGEATVVTFEIVGFSNPIDFTLSGLPTGIGYKFLTSNSGVKPNYALECEFTVGESVQAGDYHLNLVGNDGNIAKNYGFILNVANPITISSTSLVIATVFEDYVDQILVEGGFAPYEFQILENSLPLGLDMEVDGTISGIPEVAGNYLVKIQVTDSQGNTNIQDLPLVVGVRVLSKL